LEADGCDSATSFTVEWNRSNSWKGYLHDPTYFELRHETDKTVRVSFNHLHTHDLLQKQEMSYDRAHCKFFIEYFFHVVVRQKGCCPTKIRISPIFCRPTKIFVIRQQILQRGT
jgi:hypothetical protein